MSSNNGDYKTCRVYAFQRWRRGILIALLPVSFEENKDNKIPVVLAQARLLTATLPVFQLSPSKPPIPAALQQKEKNMSKPTHTAYVVKDPKEGSDQKAQWREVGAVWPHKNGKGFDVVLFEQLSISGRIVCTERKEKSADEAPSVAQ